MSAPVKYGRVACLTFYPRTSCNRLYGTVLAANHPVPACLHNELLAGRLWLRCRASFRQMWRVVYTRSGCGTVGLRWVLRSRLAGLGHVCKFVQVRGGYAANPAVGWVV